MSPDIPELNARRVRKASTLPMGTLARRVAQDLSQIVTATPASPALRGSTLRMGQNASRVVLGTNHMKEQRALPAPLA